MPVLPTAPDSFYTPSLEALKNALENQGGFITLLTASPTDQNASWAEVGSGQSGVDTPLGFNVRGTNVIGVAPLGAITGPVAGPAEIAGETGFKLTFNSIENIPIVIDGSNATTAIVVGAALIVSYPEMSDGSDEDVMYLIKAKDITVTDGQLLTIPSFDILLNYAEGLEEDCNATPPIGPSTLNIQLECPDSTLISKVVSEGDILPVIDDCPDCGDATACVEDINRLVLTAYTVNPDDSVSPPPLNLPGELAFKHVALDGISELTSYPTIDIIRSALDVPVASYLDPFNLPCTGPLTLPSSPQATFVIEILDTVCDINEINWDITGTVLQTPINILVVTTTNSYQMHVSDNGLFTWIFTKDKILLSVSRFHQDGDSLSIGSGLTMSVTATVDGNPVNGGSSVDFTFNITRHRGTICTEQV